MITTEQNDVPAGWYPDPVGSGIQGTATQSRWWDGLAWTQHTAASQTPASPVVTTEALADATAFAARVSAVGTAPATVSPGESARTAESMPLHAVDPAAALRRILPTTRAHETAHSLLAPLATAAPGRNPLQLRVHTVSIWLLATLPITQALWIFWVFSTLPAEGSAWSRALAVLFPFVLAGALAGQDTRLLEGSGHLRTAPWFIALLAPPIYLAVRGVRVARATGAASWPLLVWATAQLLVMGVWWMLDPEGVLAMIRTLA